MDPSIIASLIGAGGSLLGGLFGGQQTPQLPPELQRIYRMLLGGAHNQLAFARSPAGSTAQEKLALNAAQGGIGTLLRQKREQAMAAFGPGDQEHVGDFLSNLSGQEIGARSAIDNQHLLAALTARQQARQGAYGLLEGAGSVAAGPRIQPQQFDFPGIFGQLAQTVAYNGARQPSSALRPITGLKSNAVPGFPGQSDNLDNGQPLDYGSMLRMPGLA